MVKVITKSGQPLIEESYREYAEGCDLYQRAQVTRCNYNTHIDTITGTVKKHIVIVS